jgi:hypothetical protein
MLAAFAVARKRIFEERLANLRRARAGIGQRRCLIKIKKASAVFILTYYFFFALETLAVEESD